MKYLFKAIGVLLLVLAAGAGFVVGFVVGLLYHLALYPLWHLHWHPQPWAWIAEVWQDFRKEVRECWSDEPIFYPGWTEGLTNQQAQDKINKHTASWLAYCKRLGSFNPK